MKIQIDSVLVWTSSGNKQANQFEVRSVSYQNGPAFAECALLASNGMELAMQLVTATAAQTATWTDDTAFYKVLAQNAGLTPL